MDRANAILAGALNAAAQEAATLDPSRLELIESTTTATGDQSEEGGVVSTRTVIGADVSSAVEQSMADARARAEAQQKAFEDAEKAEFEAVKKRTADARAMALTVERADVLDKILGATDNFDRAVMASKAQASASEGAAAVAARYTGEVADAFAEAFKSLNAEKIDEVGVPFDPMVHEAAMTAPDDEIPADHVQKVFQYGLKVGERLVRPATVVVSEGPM
mmetsp:Transcript_5611/g.16564  ORF Transcript_5611/g.16564 Transcript_5611/m.16564 type:complete len:220 (-) Transcript_5611:39-698(-)